MRLCLAIETSFKSKFTMLQFKQSGDKINSAFKLHSTFFHLNSSRSVAVLDWIAYSKHVTTDVNAQIQLWIQNMTLDCFVEKFPERGRSNTEKQFSSRKLNTRFGHTCDIDFFFVLFVRSFRRLHSVTFFPFFVVVFLPIFFFALCSSHFRCFFFSILSIFYSLYFAVFSTFRSVLIVIFSYLTKWYRGFFCCAMDKQDNMNILEWISIDLTLFIQIKERLCECKRAIAYKFRKQ